MFHWKGKGSIMIFQSEESKKLYETLKTPTRGVRCKYCKPVSDPCHPEGLPTWSGYECENPNSKQFHNTRSTFINLCDDCDYGK